MSSLFNYICLNSGPSGIMDVQFFFMFFFIVLQREYIICANDLLLFYCMKMLYSLFSHLICFFLNNFFFKYKIKNV